jgi:hypothetical protein
MTASGNVTISMGSIGASNIGQSGNIIIVNGAGVSFNPLPSNMKTPSGAQVQFVTTTGAVSIISYYVLNAQTILCNYIGNFA